MLLTAIWVRPTEAGWAFAGVCSYDQVLSGGLKGDGFQIERRPDAAADPDALLTWFTNADGITPTRPGTPRYVEDYDRDGHRTGITFYVNEPVEVLDEDGKPVTIRPISGGSYAVDGVSTGCPAEGPPKAPRARRRPGEAGAAPRCAGR